MVAEYLLAYCAPGVDGLLLPAAGDPGKHLHATTLARHFRAAAKTIGVEGLHFHDLRHTGLTLAAQAGAITAEL